MPPPQITFPAATAEEDPDRDEPLRNGNAPDLRESTPDIETHPDPQWVGHKIHPLGQPAGEIAAPPSDASEDTRATERTDLGPDAAEKPIPGHPADEERPARDDSSKPQMRQSHEEPQLKGRDTDESPHTDDTCRRPIDGEHERDGIAADGETANYFAVSVNSTFIWKPFDWLRWGQIEEETSQTEQELEVLDRFSEKYYKEIRVVLTAQGKGRPPIAQVEAFNVQADDWEPVKVKHHRGLGKLGVGVAAEVTGDTIADWLPETSRDKLNDLAEIILTPETLLPKLLNHAVTGLAIHAGIPHPVAKLAGDAAEQAAEPLIEPVGLRADVADGLEGLTVTLDLAHGEITQAVVDAALDRLADRLKKSLDDTSDGGDDASEE